MSSKADRSEKRFTKAEKSWIMYDWANSIYATNIMAAIFPIYFAMQANETGNKLYGFAVSAAAQQGKAVAADAAGYALRFLQGEPGADARGLHTFAHRLFRKLPFL